MYDMSRVNANGYFDSENSEEVRYEKRKAMNAQRLEDYKNGTYALRGDADMYDGAMFSYQGDFLDYLGLEDMGVSH